MEGSVADENEGRARPFPRNSVDDFSSAAEILVFPDVIDPSVCVWLLG